MEDKEYNVLWIEDESEDMKQMITFFKRKKINLRIYPSISSGKIELEQSPNYWDAILLDGEVPNGDNDVPDLGNTIGLIMWMTANKVNLPVFIFTGKDNVINDLSFKAMTSNISVKIFRKNSQIRNEEGQDVDVDRYLRDEMIKAMDSREDRILNNNYPELFQAFREIGEISTNKNFEKEVSKLLMPILKALHRPEAHEEFSPCDKYNSLRQVVELIYRKLGEFGLIPSCCLQDEKVNLNQCQMYITGRIAFVKRIYRYPYGVGILPCYIEKILFQILSLGSTNSHTVEVSDTLTDEEEAQIEAILKTRDSRFLIFGYAMQLIDVIIWLNEYLHDNQDINKNAEKVRNSYGEIHYDDSLDVMYFNEDFVIRGDDWQDGDYIEIDSNDKIKQNRNPQNNMVYPYYIKKDN